MLRANTERVRPLLEVNNVVVRFGGIVALNGVSFDVAPKQICGLIGPNGAGKTTLFNCLSRLYTPQEGSLAFNGLPLLNEPASAMAVLGIGRTFQNLSLFRTMSVLRNVMVGYHCRMKGEFVANAFNFLSARASEQSASESARQLVDLLGLNEVVDRPVSSLPFGTQKRVELARALASQPKLLLLDEPAAGLNHSEVKELEALILKIRDRFETAVLLVEHHMHLVMSVCENVVVLDFGKKIAEGKPDAIQRNPDVIRAYTGE